MMTHLGLFACGVVMLERIIVVTAVAVAAPAFFSVPVLGQPAI